MSNASIAAYRTHLAHEVVAFLRQRWPGQTLAINSPRFESGADILVVHDDKTVLVWNRPGTEAAFVYTQIGTHFGCWWLCLFLHEHLCWEYHFHHGGEFKHQFMPYPEMWDLSDAHLGDAEEVAAAWSIKPAHIHRYLRRWDQSLKVRKAYFWRDRSTYKNSDQGFDFLRSLTGLGFPSS